MAINQACREQLLRNAICCVCPKGEMNKYESPQKQQKVSVIQCNLTKIYLSSKTPMEAYLNSKLPLIRGKKDNYLISLCTANRMRWWIWFTANPYRPFLATSISPLLSNYVLLHSLQVQYLHNQENKLWFGGAFTVSFIPSIVLHI